MKVAVVTGAGGGIGSALCSVFKSAGYRTLGLDVRQTLADVTVIVDLTRFCRDESYATGVVNELREELGGGALKALVNNAAVQILKSSENLSVDDWQRTLDVNLLAPFLLTQRLLPQLMSAGGSVINISSIHEKLTKPGFVAYATSKAALSAMTRNMAVDLGPKIRINGICPAAIETPMLRAGFEGREEEFMQLAASHPSGRIGTPEEIARVALFLASDDCAFMTGSLIEVNGGIASRLHDPI